jgi:hypothetical protein
MTTETSISLDAIYYYLSITWPVRARKKVRCILNFHSIRRNRSHASPRLPGAEFVVVAALPSARPPSASRTPGRCRFESKRSHTKSGLVVNNKPSAFVDGGGNDTISVC